MAMPADATIAARPNSRRLIFTAGRIGAGAGPQLEQPLDTQLPHPLEPLRITFSDMSMINRSFLQSDHRDSGFST
jgi:hypothetical protein